MYKEIWPSVKRFVLSNSGDDGQARDVFHDGILNVLVMIKQSKLGLDTDLSGYLFVTCKNIWMRKAKRDTRVVYSDELLDYEKSGDNFFLELLNDEKVKLLNSKLMEIGERCKELLRLTYFNGTSLKEAAEILGYSSAGTVKSTQHRCKEKLRLAVQGSSEFNELRR